MAGLSAQRWQEIAPHLDRALDMAESERARLLASIRAQDPALAADLQSLLEEHLALAGRGFLEQSPVPLGNQHAKPADPFGLVGQMLEGRFKVERQVAEGGFGIVYRAHQLVLDRAVALKVLKTPAGLTAAQRDTFHRTFEEEGRTIARLKHPNIVDVYDFGVTERVQGEPLLWMALEWLEGKTLEEELDGRAAGAPMTPAEALDLLRPVLQTMGYAHRQQVVHRDLKPANIFLAEREGVVTVKVLDFGIAKIMAGADDEGVGGSNKTTKGLRAFSPDFAAPEQIAHARTGPWTDVHALGLVLTYMLTGRPPYHGAHGDLFLAAMAEQRPSPAAAGYPAGPWEEVLARAMALRPADRHQNADELLEALERSVPTATGVAAPSTSAAPTPAPARRRPLGAGAGRVLWAHRRVVLAGVVALGLVVTIAYVKPFRRALERTEPGIRSLAVLPLDNLSNDPAQEYVADSMTEALITELGKVGSLRIIARTSVMKYKGTHTPPGTVARELGVQALVAGSVLLSGDRVRITVQLIDPSSERRTWSEVHERDLRDVLTLQREVTVAIAGQVRARLTAPEQARLGKLRPVNPEAYESVLRARYLSFRTTDADSRAAIALLERSIALDPDFAPAYADLAAAHVTRLTFVKPEETRELEEKAFAAAEKALSLDPDLPEAYLARGDLLWTHSHRFAHERAAQEFRRALSLNPNSDQAHRRLARVYVHLGFFEEALQHAGIALAINPSNAQALNSRAQALLWMGKDEEALATLLSIPGPVLPELVEANTVFALLRLGRRGEARFHLQRALRKYPNDATGNLAGIEAILLTESEPLRAAALIEVVARRKAVNPAHHAAYFAACTSARLRRAKEAVDWLREAAETGFPCHSLFARDPNLDPIRQDPSFQAFMSGLEKQSTSLRNALFPARD